MYLKQARMNIDYINTGYSKVHKAHQISPLIFKRKLLLGYVIISGICLLERKRKKERKCILVR